jgi:non-ribosomal peptide synthetase component E (peptide arylation enzyme)
LVGSVLRGCEPQFVFCFLAKMTQSHLWPRLDCSYTERFTEMVMAGFGTFGDKVAFIDGITEEQRTFADIVKDVNGVARSLDELGIGKGDVVGL